jgi:hypothetical protein
MPQYDWLGRVKDLFGRQISPGGGGYKFLGCLLVRICSEMATSGLGLVEQETIPWVLTSLALAGHEEHCSTHIDNNCWYLMVGLLKNTYGVLHL